MYKINLFLLILCCILANIKLINSLKCNRTPEGHGALKTPADGRFHIRISETSSKYTPGRTYTITLEGIDAGLRQVPFSVRHKFSGFFLVVERQSNDSITQEISPSSFGLFTLMHGSTLTKITCANMVTHTTTTPKSEIQVLWTAPEAGSGCVAFKATIIEHRDVWYMDDGPLTKEFCEDDQNFDDTMQTQIDPCCACAEAKYELTFEGLWSRNTHPKDFPTNSWLTRFSDIIGASHTVDYRFWQYGEQASDGLQQVAEHGATRLLESELKGQSEHIRTIIKARGLSHPNVTGKTFAVFRVDPNHHLMSFVTMLDPSPDWFLGVTGLELCLPNCTWMENKILDLYPWDAGTDSGPTYISPDQPTNPRDLIRRIKPDYPNDPRSPFYDPNAVNMKPLARLYLLRQRLYEKNCPEESSREEGGGGSSESMRACSVTPWGRYSKCSSDCGRGHKYRQRSYLNEQLAQRMDCKKELTQQEECQGTQPNCENAQSAEVEDVTESMCALSDWGDWSECPSCGVGYQIKQRKYLNRRAKKKCEGGDNHPRLIIRKKCMNQPPCVGEISPSEEEREQERGEQEEEEEEAEQPEEEEEQGGEEDGVGEENGEGGEEEEGGGEEEGDGNDKVEEEEEEKEEKEEEEENGEDGENENNGNEEEEEEENKEEDEEEEEEPDCELGDWTLWGKCSVPCGGGSKFRHRFPADLERCGNETIVEETKQCNVKKCPVPEYCFEEPISGKCGNFTNMWFYNYNHLRCEVFTWSCSEHENRFATYELCLELCTGFTEEFQDRNQKPQKRPNKNRGIRRKNYIY